MRLNNRPLRCNQCEAMMINGMFCHELGCPSKGSARCSICKESIRHVYYANDWDGIELCKECANTQTQYEEEEAI